MIRTIEGEILFWNQGAERMYGWSKDESVGRLVHDLLRSALDPPLEEILESLVKNGSWEGELDQQRSDGMSLVVASRWVIDRERWGTHSAILVMNKDITARKRAEAEAARERQLLSESIEELVRAREAALEHSRLKSEFLANMSHEIRTPMNGVIGMADLLLDTKLDEDQRDLRRPSGRVGQVLLRVINDILDFSKIEAGKLTIETEDFNLRVVMADVAELMAATASQKHLELTCDFPPGLAEWYEGDAGRIRQILVNLVGNAVKFTNDGRGRRFHSADRANRRPCDGSTLGCAIPESGSPPVARRSSLRVSPRPTAASHADMEAQAWGWPSAAG